MSKKSESGIAIYRSIFSSGKANDCESNYDGDLEVFSDERMDLPSRILV
ncbi:hypothetical protein J1TS3_02320 [Siminovitchia fordii]|uniref:Uncharacterized protein n=1 Tax=Siminovitchia fordii TaxID=254759 RepID=A0ABQ4K1X9_9BACI|nr:hypothetical protein J1TS3_02320 [Siminovitchia fordii]